MPTRSCISRGWRTFMTMNQPIAHEDRGPAAQRSRLEQDRDETGGSPRRRTARRTGSSCSRPAAARRDRHVRQAEHEAHDGRDRAEDDAEDRLAAQEAAERARRRCLEEPRLVRSPAARAGRGTTRSGRGPRPCRATGSGRGQDVAERADARDGELLERARRAGRVVLRGWSRNLLAPGRQGRPGRSRATSSRSCHGARISRQLVREVRHVLR